MTEVPRFKVVTTDGVTAKASTGEKNALDGLTLENARSDCKVRNQRAEELGIQTRYEVVEYIAA